MESANTNNPTREEAERFAKLVKSLDVEKQRALLLMINGAAVLSGIKKDVFGG